MMVLLIYILATIAVALFMMGIILWTAGALFYDFGQRSIWSWCWISLWIAACAGLLLLLHPIWIPMVSIILMFIGFATWWRSLSPSHGRDWDPNFSQLPLMIVEGNTLTVQNVRNTQYRTLKDYDCCYENRQYDLNQLRAIDFLILFWGSEVMSHPMVVFDFGNDQHLCVSIEVRYRNGESYNLLGGIYRQNEIMYVVSDERDAILRRTLHSKNHNMYLYRLQLPESDLRPILNDYIQQINEIHDQPRWYNVLTANCTTSIYHQLTHRPKWDWRMLINGQLDRMMYERATYYQGLTFEMLKEQSWINERANRAQPESFSREIREGLPGFE